MAPHELGAEWAISPTPHMGWCSLLAHCKAWRSETRASLGVPFTRMTVIPTPSGCKLFALGTPPSSSHQTLMCADIPADGSDAVLRPVLNPDQFRNSNSAEFSLLCERQRVSAVSGVAEYSMNANQNVLITTGEEVYRWNASAGKDDHIYSVCPNVGGTFIFDAQMCPSDPSLVSLVVGKNLCIERNGTVIHVVQSDNLAISNGTPSFISQEELDRFTAMWWSPVGTRLLYEQVDETKVKGLAFDGPGKEPTETMRYPLAGTTNALSTLRMVICDGDEAKDVGLRVPLNQMFPWVEYVTRAGFMNDGVTVWVQVMNRTQTRCALILIPESDWSGIQNSGVSPLISSVIIHEERSISWINTHNLTCPIDVPSSGRQPLIYATETSSHCHLYVVEAGLNLDGQMGRSEIAITRGDWSVCKSAGLVVDKHRQHVYFLANITHPTELNLCVASYSNTSCEVNVLTEDGWTFRSERASHHLSISPDVGFACWLTHLGTPPQCRFYSLQHQPGKLPEAHVLCQIGLPGYSIPARIQDMTQPQLIEYRSQNSGMIHYSLVIRPPGSREGIKYPVLLYVYGGPGIQTVKNDWATWLQMQKFTQLGFVVVMIDGRGSHNRGRDFEAPIKEAMGTVEIDDQIEGLQEVAARTRMLDLSRVAIQGWSYGGFLSLMAIAKHPNIFRACVAGGAVTDWKLYDTAYTERYLGYPVTDVYQKSSVISMVDKLPDEPGRVFLVHGMIDENVHFRHTETLIEAMVKAGKPYQLQIFPSERHGVRSAESAAHLDASIIQFICDSLQQGARV